MLAIVSALAGGALSGVLTAANTAGRLTSIENAIVRIEARIYNPPPAPK
jgi:orotate phosphoribosyltransferase